MTAATRLAPFELRRFRIKRPGQPNEISYAPLCSLCGEPILKFGEANLVVGPPDGFQPEPSRECGDGLLERMPGSVFALHFHCDTQGMRPWKPLDTVLRWDQRLAYARRRDKKRSGLGTGGGKR